MAQAPAHGSKRAPNAQTAAGFLRAASALAEQIWERRVRARDGSVTWLRPASESRREPLAEVRVDPFLYDGSAGISLFFAAIERVAPGGEHRSRSLAALAATRGKLAELAAQPERAASITRMGIGGLVGIGSLVYSFVRIGELLGEPDLIREACALTVLITAERIARDESPDVLSGSAGAILALLALHRARPEAAADGRTPLAVAAACAQHLIASRLPAAGGACGWRTLAGMPPLAGFTHGASGILLALARLHEETTDPRLLEAARGALAFERTLFSPRHGSWRDMRSADGAPGATAWCVGAAGIALTRLGLLSTAALAGEPLREDLEHGLRATGAAPLAAIDYLCCGNLGRAEALHHAFLVSGDEASRRAAESLAAAVVARAHAGGGFRWRRQMDHGLFDPSFFTGAAGVGYTLLRLAGTVPLPCILLLE